MSLSGIFGERIAESTESAPGTGTFSLGGALGGFQTFVGAIGSGNIAAYFARDSGGSNWEAGYGTVTDANPDTLTRTAVFASSNSGNKVNFATAPTVFSASIGAILNSLLSSHKDSARPAWLPAGGFWIDETNDPTWTLNLWDGTDDIPLIDFDVTNNGFALKAIHSANAGAAAGPTLVLDRASPSPADNDFLGAVQFKGRDDASPADTITYAQLVAQILDASDGTEDGQAVLQAMVAGSLTTILTAGANGITASRTLTMSSKPIELARGADVASAGTTDIWGGDDGNTVHVTGTTTITSFGTAPQAGAWRLVRFNGALTLTHSANLILPGSANITTANGDAAFVYAVSTTIHQVVLYQKFAAAPWDGGPDYILIRDEKADGTDGGTATSGSWLTRDLNTEVADTGSHASVASDQVTLAAGTYEVNARAPFNFVGGARLRWQNVTDGTTAAISESSSSGQTTTHVTTIFLEVRGRFTIAAQKTFELQYFCEATKSTDGLGADDDIAAGDEIYSVVELRKVA